MYLGNKVEWKTSCTGVFDCLEPVVGDFGVCMRRRQRFGQRFEVNDVVSVVSCGNPQEVDILVR